MPHVERTFKDGSYNWTPADSLDAVVQIIQLAANSMFYKDSRLHDNQFLWFQDDQSSISTTSSTISKCEKEETHRGYLSWKSQFLSLSTSEKPTAGFDHPICSGLFCDFERTQTAEQMARLTYWEQSVCTVEDVGAACMNSGLVRCINILRVPQRGARRFLENQFEVTKFDVSLLCMNRHVNR